MTGSTPSFPAAPLILEDPPPSVEGLGFRAKGSLGIRVSGLGLRA